MTHYDARYDFRMQVLHNVSPYMHHEVPDCAPPHILFEEILHGYYHAMLDALTPPEPVGVTNAARVSVLMLTDWGLPILGEAIGRDVQRKRDALRETGIARLRDVLLNIETRMK